jgi:hypothetical protein
MSIPDLLVRRVRARNDAEKSENAIHADDVARRYGFGGGLVPGVTVYAYMSVLPARYWGEDWVHRGTMSLRLIKPVYDGEEIEVRAVEHGGGSLLVEVVGPDGIVRASATADLPEDAPPPPDLARFPATPLPDPEARPPAGEDVLAAVPLGAFDRRWDAATAAAFMASIGEDADAWPFPQLAPDGWLIRGANDVLSRNVRLGPWIHVSSEITHHRGVPDGARVSTRGRVADLYRRKGHRFVELDVVILADADLAWSVRHVAIYQLRATPEEADHPAP